MAYIDLSQVLMQILRTKLKYSYVLFDTKQKLGAGHNALAQTFGIFCLSCLWVTSGRGELSFSGVHLRWYSSQLLLFACELDLSEGMVVTP